MGKVAETYPATRIRSLTVARESC